MTVLAFERVRNFGFVDFDDRAYVFENERVLCGLTPDNAAWAFSWRSTTQTSNWHPVTWLSFMTDVSLFGPQPEAMHLVNLSIPIFNVLLLYLLLQSATGDRNRSAFVAALFAVHPVHVESVVWISERKDVLSTAFILCALWSYIQWTRRSSLTWYILTLLAFSLSLLAKQMYVTLPFLLLLLDYWPLGRTTALPSYQDNSVMPWKAIVSENLAFLVVAVAFSVIAVYAQSQGNALGTLEGFPLPQRVLNALIVYAKYVKQTVWPLELAVYYPYPQGDMFRAAVRALLALAAVTVFVLSQRRKRPWIAVGWLWYVGTLVPVIGIVQVGSQQMADRYMYFPMIGLLIMVAWLGSGVSLPKPRKLKTVLSCLVAAGFCVLLVLTRLQTSYWRDTLSLFQRAAAVAPGSLAWGHVAVEFQTCGQTHKAAAAAQRALDFSPASQTALNMLGTIALNRGRLGDAESYFQRSTSCHPESATAWYNLGLTLSLQRRFEEATSTYQHALKVAPERIDIRTNLAAAYLATQQNERAMDELQIVLDASPDFPQGNFHYAIALMKAGATRRAINHFQVVLRASPDLWQSHLYLAQLYESVGGERATVLHHAQKAFDLSGGSQLAAEFLAQISAEITPEEILEQSR